MYDYLMFKYYEIIFGGIASVSLLLFLLLYAFCGAIIDIYKEEIKSGKFEGNFVKFLLEMIKK